jgi:hypothetical protein
MWDKWCSVEHEIVQCSLGTKASSVRTGIISADGDFATQESGRATTSEFTGSKVLCASRFASLGQMSKSFSVW